jgi:hypothetical protein
MSDDLQLQIHCCSPLNTLTWVLIEQVPAGPRTIPACDNDQPLRDRPVTRNAPPISKVKALAIEPGSISGAGGGASDPACTTPAKAVRTNAKPTPMRVVRASRL